MATFKVGQRVRIVHDTTNRFIGMTAIITHARPFGAYEWAILVDGYRSNCEINRAVGGAIGADSDDLAPLTDPRADAFIESIKKLAREPRIPVTTPAFGD